MVEQKGLAKKRIFWLGMHKILVKTELPRLRQLGFEVFNPPYLSSIQDQSANLDWDAYQLTTLPKEIFEKLSNYNFFYNSISEEIAEILNYYFDAIIVTISPAWLAEVLKVYKKKIIYRVYGQHYLISKELENNRCMLDIVSRDNFWFIPHAVESVREEDSWLREREVVVPYCLTEDIFEFADTWQHSTPKWPKIAITCPNIKNPYFDAHYHFLKNNFSESFYRFYGVQLSQIDDPQVVGTLPRYKFLQSLQKSAGYLYSYTEERVCYLPPIEMMVIGGPVIYLKGSLLDRYFKFNSPGRCLTIEEARIKSKLLLQNDKTFIEEIILSQKEVRNRYSPDTVWPLFDNVFEKIMQESNQASSWLSIGDKNVKQNNKRIYIFHHFPGSPVIAKEGSYTAYDGIPRVVRQITKVLSAHPDVEILITARADQVANMNGFFRNNINAHRIKILCINSDKITHPEVNPNFLLRKSAWVWQVSKKQIKSVVKLFARAPKLRKEIREWYARFIDNIKNTKKRTLELVQNKIWHVDVINNDPNCYGVLIPHYYWFPDALKLKKKVVLYLPDYMPHFFHETGEFSATEGFHTTIGKKLSQKAQKVFCNSNFTKSYLPHSRLKVVSDKIHVAYLPFLNSNFEILDYEALQIDPKINEKPYLFYPTRPHPNKNLGFLLQVFDHLVTAGFDVNLVLTTTLVCDQKLTKIFQSMKNKDRILFLETVTDDTLTYLYRKAGVLCFTSLAEGNFPPQIHEALRYDTPIVAGRLGFITERVPSELADSIIFCEPNDLNGFVEGCKKALQNRESILIKQRQLLQAIESGNINAHFQEKVLEIFNLN